MQTLDRRTTPARPDLAAAFLKGQVEAARFVEGRPARVILPVVPLTPSTQINVARDTELVFGEEVTLYDEAGGHCFVQSARDFYVGYAVSAAFGHRGLPATHRVAALRTHLYPGPSIKLPPTFAVPMNTRLTVERLVGDFAVTDTGLHVVTRHLAPVGAPEPDYVAVAERYVGTPYLWGGRTSLGIDCSGLVQASLDAAGIAAPRDSDMQEQALGERIEVGPDLMGVRRGDLIFWRGHVGIVVGDGRLLHANGHHMAVVAEPLMEAVERIAAKSYGSITAVKRLA
ncbi:C40 family peptidase [Phreatobacter sp.]|uniref:C40 family peptidase n=1 Tax=Phreatobacter sp. TaxID=1966341 RepID=UPI003F72DFE0